MPPKAVQVRYIREIVKLMLGFMYRLLSEQNIPFSIALTDYVDIYRKTAFYNLTDASETQQLRPGWDECAIHLEKLFAGHLSQGHRAVHVEEEGLQLLWPHLSERIERDLPLVEYRREAAFGCFYYHGSNAVIDLHFTNAVMPQAPFKDPSARALELYALVRDCARTHPEAALIKSGTWLNEYPPFRGLFPEAWKDSGERKSYNSLGWWGQFVNHEGDIHARNVRTYRASGEFPYRGVVHQCETQALQDHLRRLAGDPERIRLLDREAAQ
jgi:hypothetical protein